MAHNNTLFSRTLSFIPRHLFQKLERRHKTGRSSRQFGFKEQFTALAFIILAGRNSLRDAVRYFEAMKNRLYHFGLKNVARSTFAEANNCRPVAFFADLFKEMYALCQPQAPKHKFRFKSKLYSMDATTIKLCLSLFPWASFRQKKGGVKMNVVHDHSGYIPAFVTIGEARQHESQLAKNLDLPCGSIVVFDRGYNDYNWFSDLNAKDVFFVTRLKHSAKYKLLEHLPFNHKTGVTSDHAILVKSKTGTLKLRRIGYCDQETGKRYVFLTNNFKLASKTITSIYKDRWQIEIFFREIKQNLHIKSFVGNSENAVLIQIYTALTVYLLLAYQKFLCKIGHSIQQICQLLQCHLLLDKTLEEVMKPPTRKIENTHQLSLFGLIA